MNEMNNNLQPTAAQEYQIDINITPKAFAGLARQGMLYQKYISQSLSKSVRTYSKEIRCDSSSRSDTDNSNYPGHNLFDG